MLVTMPIPLSLSLASLLVLPAGAERLNDAELLVEAQVQAAAAAVAVLEKVELPPAARAESLLPLARELAQLHARRSQLDAQQLEAAEVRAAEDAEVQRLALRLLRAVELCAASDYSGSLELRAAVQRLALAIEGELEAEEAAASAPVTAQSGAE